MLRLDLPTEPRWLDLPLGVRVRVKPLTTALEIAADNVAGRLVAERRAARGSASVPAPDEAPDDTVAGIEPLSPPAEGRPSADAALLEADLEFGARVEAKVIALGQVLILEWEGVGNAAGTALADVTPETIAQLLRIDRIGQAFLGAVRRPLEALYAEGNGFGASPLGTSAGAPSTATGAEPHNTDAAAPTALTG